MLGMFFFIAVDVLEIQEKYARDVLQYLQILDPGNTWRKSQIMARLRSIMTALAQVRNSYKKSTLITLKKPLSNHKSAIKLLH